MNFFDIFHSTSKELLIAVCVLTFLYFFRRSQTGNHGKYPPGPVGLPIVGYLPFLTKKPHLKLQKLSKKYGDVFSIRLGSSNVVVLNSAKVIREILNKPEVLGRPDGTLFDYLQTPFFLNGKLWQEHRRFSLSALRDLGLGKSGMHELIMEEIHHLLKRIEQENAMPCDVKLFLTPSMSNNICSLIFGKRYDYEDPERIFLDETLNEETEYLNQTLGQSFFSWIRKLPFSEKLLKIDRFVDRMNVFKDFILQKVQDHEKTLDSNHPRDYIDMYLIEMKERKKKDPQTTLSEQMIPGTVNSLFGAGSETVRNTISWALYSMASYPEVQREVQKELDNEIGTERSVTLEDMKNLPYTQSVLTELHRWQTVVPINILRMVLEDVEMCGYNVPKGTLVMANLWAAHRDPECWANPGKFQPRRFLSKDGKSIVKSDNFIPFSYGKRSCPGEGLALTETFLYFTSILQKFTIKLPPGEKPNFDGELSITYHPKPHKLCFIPRNS